MRYFYVIYPVLSIFGGIFLSEVFAVIWKTSRITASNHQKQSHDHDCSNTSFPEIQYVHASSQSHTGIKPHLFISRMLTSVFLLFLLLLWPVSCSTIYGRAHTRITASEWIYQHIPYGSVIAGETWDDLLPLSLSGEKISQQYTIAQLVVTGPDTQEKQDKLKQIASSSDYIVLTSNRGYGSMTSVPDMYPHTVRFYRSLFNGTAGFAKVAEFTSRPTIPVPIFRFCTRFPFLTYGSISDDPSSCVQTEGLTFIDDYSDETWTVYDHPKVTIFKHISENNVQ
jgi:hypothetical protein